MEKTNSEFEDVYEIHEDVFATAHMMASSIAS